jgi:hypothetical protein
LRLRFIKQRRMHLRCAPIPRGRISRRHRKGRGVLIDVPLLPLGGSGIRIRVRAQGLRRRRRRLEPVARWPGGADCGMGIC